MDEKIMELIKNKELSEEELTEVSGGMYNARASNVVFRKNISLLVRYIMGYGVSNEEILSL